MAVQTLEAAAALIVVDLQDGLICSPFPYATDGSSSARARLDTFCERGKMFASKRV